VDEAKATMRLAHEQEVNLFGTAQAYGFGASERLLGDALRSELKTNRDELVIATKGRLRKTHTGVAHDASAMALRSGGTPA
jgi:aryl-alcohol dehydrogenase-like predicted oxidoreductase